MATGNEQLELQQLMAEAKGSSPGNDALELAQLKSEAASGLRESSLNGKIKVLHNSNQNTLFGPASVDRQPSSTGNALLHFGTTNLAPIGPSIVAGSDALLQKMGLENYPVSSQGDESLGQLFNQNLGGENQKIADLSRAMPVSSGIGSLGGALTSPVNKLFAGVNKLPIAQKLAGNTLQGFTGASQMAAGSDPNISVNDLLKQGAIGGLGGAVSTGITEGVNKLGEAYLQKKFGAQALPYIQENLGNPLGANKLKAKNAESLDQAGAVIKQLTTQDDRLMHPLPPGVTINKLDKWAKLTEMSPETSQLFERAKVEAEASGGAVSSETAEGLLKRFYNKGFTKTAAEASGDTAEGFRAAGDNLRKQLGDRFGEPYNQAKNLLKLGGNFTYKDAEGKFQAGIAKVLNTNPSKLFTKENTFKYGSQAALGLGGYEAYTHGHKNLAGLLGLLSALGTGINTPLGASLATRTPLATNALTQTGNALIQTIRNTRNKVVGE